MFKTIANFFKEKVEPRPEVGSWWMRESDARNPFAYANSGITVYIVDAVAESEVDGTLWVKFRRVWKTSFETDTMQLSSWNRIFVEMPEKFNEIKDLRSQ